MTAAEDEAERADGAAVLLQRSFQVSGGGLIDTTPVVAQVARMSLLHVRISNEKPADKSSSQRVGGMVKTHQNMVRYNNRICR